MHFVWVLSKILFQAKFKLIWWNHHFPWYYEKKHNTLFVSLKRLLEKFFIKYIDVLVANSLYIKNSLLDIFGQSRQIKILHPVVSSIFTWNKGIQSRQIKKIRLFTYSRWVSWKNIWLIFKLFDTLNKKYDFDLYIWWEGNDLNLYKKKYSKYKNIYFLWNISQKEIFKIASDSHIFLFPSLIDSFWLSILEMMFLSLPIIWFDYWWVFELIKNWKNGFLSKSDLEFIQKTELLIKDSTLRNKMWQESLNIARSNFSSNLFNKELWNLLN
jgi:glycosyltransferase involved in cell wall biosynthesis